MSRIGSQNGNGSAVIWFVALAFLAYGRLGAQMSGVTGTVKDASGKPVAGALVKVKSGELGLTFLVVSRGQGRYSTPALRPGKYTVQAFGAGFQTPVTAPVEVASGKDSKVDVTLNLARNMPVQEKRLRAPDYEKLMPPGEAKMLILSRCQFCHGLERIVPSRWDRERWAKTIDEMRFYLAKRPDLQARYHGGPLSDQERNLILDYVVKNFASDSSPVSRRQTSADPNRNLPAKLLSGEGTKYVAMEFDLSRIGGTHDIAVDSKGMVWIPELKEGGMLGRFDPKTLTYSRVSPPSAKAPRSLGAIDVDPNDDVWVEDYGPNAQWLRYDQKTGEFKSYSIPSTVRLKANDVNTMRYLDGNVWGTGITSGRIIKLEPVTGKVTQYPIPQGQHPYGMTIGADKTIWYVGHYDNKLVHVDPATGQMAGYKVAANWYDFRRIATDASGNLWVGAHEVNKLVKFDPRTDKFTEYTPPTEDAGPFAVDVDKKENFIWFNENYADKLARFDPRTATFVEFALPSANADGRRVRVDPTNHNRIWWDARTGRIGYIEVED